MIHFNCHIYVSGKVSSPLTNLFNSQHGLWLGFVMSQLAWTQLMPQFGNSAQELFQTDGHRCDHPVLNVKGIQLYRHGQTVQVDVGKEWALKLFNLDRWALCGLTVNLPACSRSLQALICAFPAGSFSYTVCHFTLLHAFSCIRLAAHRKVQFSSPLEGSLVLECSGRNKTNRYC